MTVWIKVAAVVVVAVLGASVFVAWRDAQNEQAILRAEQVKLGAAQADLADEKVKSQALGRERDDALRAAKGGSVLRRIARAAKWFAIGAAAGAIAAKAAHL